MRSATATDTSTTETDMNQNPEGRRELPRRGVGDDTAPRGDGPVPLSSVTVEVLGQLDRARARCAGTGRSSSPLEARESALLRCPGDPVRKRHANGPKSVNQANKTN